MTSTQHGEKRKDGYSSDGQGLSKRHKSARTFNFWVFFNQLKAAMERRDYDRVAEIMAKDEAQRIQANMKDLKYYAQHSAVTIKEFLEKIVQKDVIIDQLSDSVDQSYLMDLNADNEKLKADKRTLQASLAELDIEARLRDATSEAGDAKTTIVALQLCAGKLVSEKADLKAQLAAEVNARVASNQTTLQELHEMRGHAMAAQKGATLLRRGLAEQDHELKAAKAEAERLKAEVSGAGSQLAKNNEAICKLVNGLQDNIAKQATELKAARGFATANQQEAERLRKEGSAWKDKTQKDVAAWKTKLDAEVAAARQEATRVRQDLTTRESELKDAKAFIAKRERDMEACKQMALQLTERTWAEKDGLRDRLNDEIVKKSTELQEAQGAAALLEMKLKQREEELANRTKDFKDARDFATQWMAEAERLKAELKTDPSRTNQEALTRLAHKLKDAEDSIAKQAAEIKTIRSDEHDLLKKLDEAKARNAALEQQLALEHRALCECEKELVFATTKLDDIAAAAPALTVWKDCKEDDWAVVSISLELRFKTSEFFWIGQVKSFGYKTDPKTNFREEQLQLQWYEWDSKTHMYKLLNLGLVKRDCVLFYTDKLPADAAQKKLVEDHIKKHHASVASTTREMPRRGAVDVVMDG